jgi:tetratricopeptide (TPR) repeat protein
MYRAAVSLLLALLFDGGTQLARPKPILAALLSVARDVERDIEPDVGPAPSDDESTSAAEIERIAANVRSKLRDDPHLSPVAALNETIFDLLGFVREVDDPDLRFVLLPSVLKNRRGTCVGLGTLYLALGETLGFPAFGVMVPGHFFVRMDDRGHLRNVELLRRGEEMPDAWYEARFPRPDPPVSEYARPLALSEVLGVIEYDIGNDLKRRRHLLEARHAYQSSTRHFPSFAEAYASLGATFHLLGELDDAERSYRSAARANPSLSGIDTNLRLLHEERSAGREWPLAPAGSAAPDP